MTTVKTGLYILGGKTPVPEADAAKWGIWLETHDDERVVAFDMIDTDEWVSTVFIGHDPKHLDPPQLFETIANGGKWNNHTWRYSTWEDAVKGHNQIVAML